MLVDLVSLETSDGVTLDGTLREPTSGTANDLPFDAVITFHGVGGNFYRPYFFDAIGDHLLERGAAFIRANNRGHDLAYKAPPPLGFLGAAFENLDDCRNDWKGWLDFAEARGYKRICIWGHSLGAVKNIYFLAQEGDARITCAIASSPPRFSHSSYLARPDGELFARSVRDAQKLADAGDWQALFEIEIPTSAIMTTRTFFDKYGPEERYDIMTHLPNINIPLLVTIGTLEGNRPENVDRFGFGGSAEAIGELADGRPNLSFLPIADGDHFYSGQVDQLWTNLQSWIGKLG